MRPLLRVLAGLTGLLVVGAATLLVALHRPTSSTGASSSCLPQQDGSIAESSRFTPWEARLTRLPDPLLNPTGAGFNGDSTAGIPEALDGLQLVWIASSDSGTYAYYSSQPVDESTTASSFVGNGGLQFSIEPLDGSGSFAQWLLPHEGERATEVEISDSVGALTWSDPDDHGVRPHNVYWSDANSNFTLSGVRSPEALVTLARSIACAA